VEESSQKNFGNYLVCIVVLLFIVDLFLFLFFINKIKKSSVVLNTLPTKSTLSTVLITTPPYKNIYKITKDGTDTLNIVGIIVNMTNDKISVNAGEKIINVSFNTNTKYYHRPWNIFVKDDLTKNPTTKSALHVSDQVQIIGAFNNATSMTATSVFIFTKT
jgi:hypothetical protein